MTNRGVYSICVFLIFGLKAGAQEFYFGADLSYINEMEDCGAVYKRNGQNTDPYQIFQEAGTNLVRLRLWHTPSWYDNLNDGIRYSDFDDVRRSIMRAKEQDMDVLLDFHLSDNWSDPSKQVAPLAWSPVLNNLPVLEDSLYNYIFTTLDKLASADLLPEIVQVGNETNRGILLSQQVNDSGWVLDWNRNSALFNSAIRAIHDIENAYQEEIKIAIHIAGPENVEWYIDQFHDHGVTDFDIMGMSYYNQWHDPSFDEVGDIIQDLKSTYPDKDVMILETAYPWTSSNADNANNILSAAYSGYTPFTPLNQKNWMIALTQQVIDNGGAGVVYWEPAWVSTGCSTQFAVGSSWDNATFFDHNDALIEDGGIQWMRYAYQFPTSIEKINGDVNAFDIIHAGNELILKGNIATNVNGELTISFYMLDGRVVEKIQMNADWQNNEIYVSIPEIPAGSYLIRVEDRENRYVKIIVIGG